MKVVVAEAPLRSESEAGLRASELRRLEAELAERELELATLRAEILDLERVYLRTLGLRYAELDGVEAEIAELLATAAPLDERARARAERARERAAESEEATARVAEPEPEERRFTPTEDLKKLYRRVAKRVHPDLADDEDEREWRQDAMAEANHAYAEGDAERLRQILEEWEEDAEGGAEAEPDLGPGRVERRIEQAETRLRAIEGELARLKDSELYRLHVKREAARSRGADLLAEMAREVDKRIAAARKRLRALRKTDDPWVEAFFAAARKAGEES